MDSISDEIEMRARSARRRLDIISQKILPMMEFDQILSILNGAGDVTEVETVLKKSNNPRWKEYILTNGKLNKGVLVNWERGTVIIPKDGKKISFTYFLIY